MPSALGFTHFTSDLHYLHANIIRFCGRPFKDVDHQVEGLVANHNAIVGPDDHTLFVGDLRLNDARGAEIIGRLNGRKTLVTGNHDKQTTRKLLGYGFSAVERGSLYDSIDGVRVCYNHFPYANPEAGDQRYLELRPPNEPGVVLIHGHTHSSLKCDGSYAVHVGVDAWDYRPATYAEVADLVQYCTLWKAAVRNG
jgi:calcineurin-like phosphoesterase family protein